MKSDKLKCGRSFDFITRVASRDNYWWACICHIELHIRALHTQAIKLCNYWETYCLRERGWNIPNVGYPICAMDYFDSVALLAFNKRLDNLSDQRGGHLFIKWTTSQGTFLWWNKTWWISSAELQVVIKYTLQWTYQLSSSSPLWKQNFHLSPNESVCKNISIENILFIWTDHCSLKAPINIYMSICINWMKPPVTHLIWKTQSANVSHIWELKRSFKY